MKGKESKISNLVIQIILYRLKNCILNGKCILGEKYAFITWLVLDVSQSTTKNEPLVMYV